MKVEKGKELYYHRRILALLILLLVVTGCTHEGRPPVLTVASVLTSATPWASQSTMPPATETATATATAKATGTQTPTVTATATTLPTATLHPTQTPTLTPTPAHPLDIRAMRQRSYPGSELSLEATLPWGPGAERFIVSYLSEGNRIYALLSVPRGERPTYGWPAIIFNHGYIPPDDYTTTERYEYHVNDLGSHGYIVLKPDYRGHGRSEGEASGGYGTPDYTVDVLNALASLAAHPDVDATRIGMWGHSMGGQITLRAMVVTDTIKAGVIWAGVVASYPDLMERWRRPGPTRTPDPQNPRRSWRTELIDTYGAPEENTAFWAAISPNSFVNELSGPLQLHHGTADDSVPFELSEMLFAEAQAAGIPVGLFLYDGADHNLTQYYGQAMERTLVFFDRLVKGQE